MSLIGGNPGDLTVSEIERHALFKSDSDLFSSGESYKPSDQVVKNLTSHMVRMKVH